MTEETEGRLYRPGAVGGSERIQNLVRNAIEEAIERLDSLGGEVTYDEVNDVAMTLLNAAWRIRDHATMLEENVGREGA